MKVDVLIVGFQKCGTSAVHSFLSKHPKIIVSKPKELDFFNYDENFNKGYPFYHSFFKKPIFPSLRGFHFLESSPSYIVDQNVLTTTKRIKKYNPEIKIIAIVRNPIYRAFSAWNMYRNLYIETNKNWWIEWVLKNGGSIENVIRRTEEEFYDFLIFLQNEIKAIENNKKIECPILKNGLYSKGIKIFKQEFKENFKIFSNENLNTNTGEVLKKIGGFINLKPFDWYQFNSDKYFKGNYNYSLKEDEKSLLYNYYKNSNEELRELTNIHY